MVGFFSSAARCPPSTHTGGFWGVAADSITQRQCRLSERRSQGKSAAYSLLEEYWPRVQLLLGALVSHAAPSVEMLCLSWGTDCLQRELLVGWYCSYLLLWGGSSSWQGVSSNYTRQAAQDPSLPSHTAMPQVGAAQLSCHVCCCYSYVSYWKCCSSYWSYLSHHG